MIIQSISTHHKRSICFVCLFGFFVCVCVCVCANSIGCWKNIMEYLTYFTLTFINWLSVTCLCVANLGIIDMHIKVHTQPMHYSPCCWQSLYGFQYYNVFISCSSSFQYFELRFRSKAPRLLGTMIMLFTSVRRHVMSQRPLARIVVIEITIEF